MFFRPSCRATRMRIPAAAAVLALVSLAAAGCMGSEAPPTTTPPTTAPDLGLSSFQAGQAVSVPAAFADGITVIPYPTGKLGGEPNIGVTPKGNAFVTAGPLVMKSADHGRTWTEAFNLTAFWGPAYDPAIPNDTPVVGDPVRGLTRSSDDMLWVDTDTGRVFADFMTGLYCSKLFYSDDEGATWTASPVDCGAPVNDHQKLMSAHYGPDAPVPTNPVYPNVVYYCYNKLLATSCAVSHDGGLTFNYDRAATIAVSSAGGEAGSVQPMGPCGGINGHPAGAPDGTVYVPMTLGCPGPVVAITTDNGLTWKVSTGPTAHGAEELDPDVTVTPDGTAYMLYRGTDHLQYLVRSKDRFATWQGPWQVSPPSLHSTVFAGITSGDDGRIAMAYLGTADSKKAPSETENATRWHLFETYSLDAGAQDPTLTTIQVTPDGSPVQIGCVWLNGGGNPCRNMLDFIDMTHDGDGRPMVVFSDGCTKNCDGNATATNKQSVGRTVTVAVLDAGPSLFAAKGVLAAPAKN